MGFCWPELRFPFVDLGDCGWVCVCFSLCVKLSFSLDCIVGGCILGPFCAAVLSLSKPRRFLAIRKLELCDAGGEAVLEGAVSLCEALWVSFF